MVTDKSGKSYPLQYIFMCSDCKLFISVYVKCI